MDTLESQQQEEISTLIREVLAQNQVVVNREEFQQIIEMFSQEWRDIIPEEEYEAKILELAMESGDGFDDR